MKPFLKTISFFVTRVVNFPKRWAFRMNLIRNWSTVGWHIDRSTWEFGIPQRRLKPVALESVFPGIEIHPETLELQQVWNRKRGTSIEVDELCVLLSIVKFIQAKKILEIGTYDGNTALNFALNIPEDGQVVTIDLPESEVPNLALPVARTNASPSKIVGRQFRESEQASKIDLIRQDTAVLDWNELPKPFDLVFIDGCHDWKYVKNDTEKSLGVLREGGLIIWHDYNLPGVGDYIDEFSKNQACFWIRGTRLVISKNLPHSRFTR